jgi:hypothetical protein
MHTKGITSSLATCTATPTWADMQPCTPTITLLQPTHVSTHVFPMPTRCTQLVYTVAAELQGATKAKLHAGRAAAAQPNTRFAHHIIVCGAEILVPGVGCKYQHSVCLAGYMHRDVHSHVAQ